MQMAGKILLFSCLEGQKIQIALHKFEKKFVLWVLEQNESFQISEFS